MPKLRCVQVIDFYSGLVSKKKYRIQDCKSAAKRCYNVKPCQLATIYRIEMILVALKHDFGYKVSNLMDKLCSKTIHKGLVQLLPRLYRGWGFLGSQWDRQLKFSAYASFLILWSLSKFELIWTTFFFIVSKGGPKEKCWKTNV